jgi:hypothetical protein
MAAATTAPWPALGQNHVLGDPASASAASAALDNAAAMGPAWPRRAAAPCPPSSGYGQLSAVSVREMVRQKPVARADHVHVLDDDVVLETPPAARAVQAPADLPQQLQQVFAEHYMEHASSGDRSQLWCDKYRPTRSDFVLGNPEGGSLKKINFFIYKHIQLTKQTPK